MIGNYQSDDYFYLMNEVQGIYANMEEEITMTVAKRIKKGITDPGWAELKLAEVTKIADEVNQLAMPYSNLAKEVMENAILTAYERGYNSANQDLNILRGLWAERKVPNKIQNLVLSGKGLIESSHFNILRYMPDEYRKIVYEAIRESTTGGKTRQQAAAIALNRFADKGITGFVDKSGRRWEISSYVEMATRTASGRAAIEGHVDRQAEVGRDLVIVSDHPSECPICRPWEGKILSISGTDPKYPSLNSAISAGLFHPNCRHTITGYIPGLTKVVPGKADPFGWEVTQQQRSNERQIRKWKRREAAAIEPNDKVKAQQKIRYWQQQQRELLEGTGIKRKYDRESISMPKVKPHPAFSDYLKASSEVRDEYVYKDPTHTLTSLSKPLEIFFDVIDDEAIAMAQAAMQITQAKVSTTVVDGIEEMNIPNDIQAKLLGQQTPGQFINSQDLTDLEKELMTFTEGNSSIPDISEAMLKHNYKVNLSDLTSDEETALGILKSIKNAPTSSKYIYRVEEAGFTPSNVGDEFISGIRSYSKSYKFAYDAASNKTDVPFNNPVVFLAEKTKSINIQGYSFFDEQAEVLTAGKFKVLHTEINNGIKFVYTEQIDIGTVLASKEIVQIVAPTIPSIVSAEPKVRKKIYKPMTDTQVKRSINESRLWFNDVNHSDVRDAFHSYTDWEYTDMNAYYRNGYNPGASIMNKIHEMEKLFDNNPIPAITKGTEVYRATGLSFIDNALENEPSIASSFRKKIEDLIDNVGNTVDRLTWDKGYAKEIKELEKELNKVLVGRVVTEKSFTSTSYKYGVLGEERPIQMVIHADPDKVKTVQLAGISSFSSEAEILFAPGMDNQIEKIKIEPDINDRDLIVRVIVKTLGHNIK